VRGRDRRRVTLVEAFIRGASVHCWDNSTRGMISLTALDIIKTITNLARLNGTIAIVSVYQASQAIFECFTKVLLLHEGKQIFFGQTGDAEEYFVRMGFCRPMLTNSTADLLTSLTHSEEAREMLQSGLDGQVPETAEDFEYRWFHSHERKNLLQNLLKSRPIKSHVEATRS
jgi:ABC-type multidrug transport system ATPase subunit